MYTRLLEPPNRSFLLFGPRGVGKTAWLAKTLPKAFVVDLLDHDTYVRLLADPGRLGREIPADHTNWIVVDEVQRVPEILNEVHRLIESRRLKFALTGSSARKLRARGVNLLAGRAVTRHMHPLTASELGRDFDLKHAVRFGGLPLAWTADDPADYLAGYAAAYLREEVQQEGLTRNIAAFGRFLEAASFSQGALLNMASVARECAVPGKVVEDYFTILEDLLIAVRLPAFAKRAKRRLTSHPKFFFFDPGVFQAIRPRGPIDSPEEIQGPALETLLLSNLRAANDYGRLGYQIHYWRTATGDEVDFVLHGERGLVAFEVKRSPTVRPGDLRGLLRFHEDYPEAKLRLFHPGTTARHESGVEIVPFAEGVKELERWM